MSQAPEPQAIQDVTVGRLVPIKDLQDRFDKWLTVPEGYRAAALYPDGQVRLFETGRQRVLSLGERSAGRGIGLRLALLTTSSFIRFLPVSGLRSQDGALLKANLVLKVEIADFARFVDQAPASEGKVEAPCPDPYLACEQIRPFVRSFAAVDLLSGAAVPVLMRSLKPLVESLLANTGMRLLEMQSLAFYSAAEQSQAEEQQQALVEEQKNLTQESALAGFERQAELEYFKRRLQGEPAATITVEEIAPVQAALAKPSGTQLAATAQAQPFAFLRRKKPELLPQLPPGYLKRQVVKISISIIGIALLTVVADPLLKIAHLNQSIESASLITALWASVLIFAGKTGWDVFEKVARTEASAEPPDLLPDSKIDDIAASQHVSLDGFLRSQANQELCHTQEMIRRTWQSLNKRGQIRVAWSLNQLEQFVEKLETQVLDPSFGRPSFQLDHGNVHNFLRRQVEYDQDLLLFLAEVSEQARLLLQKSIDESITAPEAAGLEKLLNDFEYRFEARQRLPNVIDQLN